MSFLFSDEYWRVKKNGLSQGQEMACYLFGSFAQTNFDQPWTAYRQAVQQFAKDKNGKIVDPKVAVAEARSVFYKNPISAPLSGLSARLGGICVKRVPKFGFLLGYSYVMGEDGEIGLMASGFASLFSAPIINVPRYFERQSRRSLRETGKEVSMAQIFKESRADNFKPLFRGTPLLVCHSFASAALGLCGQPIAQKAIAKKLGSESKISESASNLIASCLVSPAYIALTNPISRCEVVVQSAAIGGKPISSIEAMREVGKDMAQFGMRGFSRGMGVGLVKSVISLNLFHEFRIIATNYTKRRNERLGLIPN